MGRNTIRAYRKNSHGEQVKMVNTVLCFDSAAYCSNGYVVVVNCGCNWFRRQAREDIVTDTHLACKSPQLRARGSRYRISHYILLEREQSSTFERFPDCSESRKQRRPWKIMPFLKRSWGSLYKNVDLSATSSQPHGTTLSIYQKRPPESQVPPWHTHTRKTGKRTVIHIELYKETIYRRRCTFLMAQVANECHCQRPQSRFT
jgi:hypothetical protein